MLTKRSNGPHGALISLEAAAASARGGFACMFSTSDEFETALIAERRAQGRYAASRGNWPTLMFAGCVLMVVGVVLLLA
jgi:sugar phosphate permease